MANDPVLIAYGVHLYRNKTRRYWQRIGTAWPHETGAGLTVVLNVLLPDGRIVLLEPDSADDKRLLKEVKQRQPSSSQKARR